MRKFTKNLRNSKCEIKGLHLLAVTAVFGSKMQYQKKSITAGKELSSDSSVSLHVCKLQIANQNQVPTEPLEESPRLHSLWLICSSHGYLIPGFRYDTTIFY